MTGWDVPGDSWEERMAARTRARWAPDPIALAAEAEVRAVERTLDRLSWLAVRDLTLGEATESLRARRGIVCACIGPPHCCQLRYDYRQGRALNTAAMLVATQLADYRDRRLAEAGP